jgi:hypothetical protein
MLYNTDAMTCHTEYKTDRCMTYRECLKERVFFGLGENALSFFAKLRKVVKNSHNFLIIKINQAIIRSLPLILNFKHK